jgi:hypothetical protein
MHFLPVGLIADTLAHDLKGFGYHDESVGIDFADHFLKTGQLRERDDRI